MSVNFGSTRHLLISGATGFIGSNLVRAAFAAGVEPIVISRNPQAARAKLKVGLAFASADALPDTFTVDAIVHLAGANVMAMPWTAARKRVLKASRIEIAESLLRFVARATKPPGAWVQASAVGIYPTRASQPLTELSSAASGFAAELCQAIEATAARASTHQLRVAQLRFGLVLGRDGGVCPLMRLGTKIGGGAVVGSGAQRVAWIHVNDVVQLIARASFDTHLHGAINAVAPSSPSYREFASALSKASHRPLLWRLMRPILGERAPLLLEGAQIEPALLARQNFAFAYPDLASAFAEIFGPARA
jgi:uncharacterized protein